MPRTTKQDYAFYKSEVYFWMKHFGLTSWDCYFSHRKSDESLAAISWDREVGNAVFYLATVWGKKCPVNEQTLSRSAFHEVCELLLAELRMMSEYFVKATEVNRAVHEAIQHLVNTVFEYEWSRRISQDL